jgi:serralysin
VTPSATINNVTLPEGDSGSTSAVFTVTLAPAPTTTVSLNYATGDGSAVAPGDYTAKTGTLSFSAGQNTKTISVPVKGDKAQEANETFVVNLSGAVGLTISDTQGQATITNDDAPTLSIADKSTTEGNTGTKNLTFTVTLSGAALNTVTVNYATAVAGPAGPTVATPDVDYVTSNGTVTFTAGQTSRTFTVAIKGDTEDESDETFLVNLSAPSNATIADGQAVGTIVDNE